MNIQLTFIMLFISTYSWSQSISTGSGTTFYVGAQASFFAGGNTTFNGKLQNNGRIVSYSDIDFVGNTVLGNLKFVGPANQNLSGDSVTVGNIELDKGGTLVLLSERMIIEGELDVTAGVMEAEDENELLLSGTSASADQGFVTGNLVGFISPRGANFPMGVSGFANYITISGAEQNALIRVECKVPEASRLIPTEDMIGIADEVEWVLTTTNGDSIEVTASAVFNGVDLTSFSNGTFFRAQDYSPTLVKMGPSDTVYQDLGVSSIDNTDEETFGEIVSEKSFYISSKPTYINIALIPQLLNPEFFVPNAFSPNGDLEENRVFRPYFAGASISFIKIEIWDSFQNSIYSVSNTGTAIDLSTLGWDGKLANGQVASEGVYYFSTVINANSQTYTKAGSFLLTK